jgi:hypothetical protein
MKKVVYVGVAIAVVIAIVGFSVELKSEKSEKSVAYHVTLADPKLYTDGIFTDIFKIQKGTYQFSFVPNGDSPQTLSIALKGATFSFAEDFQLQATPHETVISTYYTWDYLGKKEIQVPEDQQLQIVINPHGNLLGSVSLDLAKT